MSRTVVPTARLSEEDRISDTTPDLVAATRIACREHGRNHEIDVVVIDKTPDLANRITAIGEGRRGQLVDRYLVGDEVPAAVVRTRLL